MQREHYLTVSGMGAATSENEAIAAMETRIVNTTSRATLEALISFCRAKANLRLREHAYDAGNRWTELRRMAEAMIEAG